jgi:hypothetical protein
MCSLTKRLYADGARFFSFPSADKKDVTICAYITEVEELTILDLGIGATSRCLG